MNSDSNYPGVRSPNLFILSATPLAPHTTAEIEAAIYAEIERLKTEPVSAKELEKVLNNLDADLVRALRSNGGLLSCHKGHGSEFKRMLVAETNLEMCSACHKKFGR